MHLQPNAHRRTDEYRRYFPDWTSRSLLAGQELEADHNSYLAGGYAEEFGYLAQNDASRGVPVLDGESPDEYEVRLVQGAAMHPGYPLRPYPFAVDGESVADHRALSSGRAVPDGIYKGEDHGTFVSVKDRPYERQHRQPAYRRTAVLTRLLAALVSLRFR
jgi:hypothetical protein